VGETSFEGGGLSDHDCRMDAGHRFDPVWRRRIASLGLVGSVSLRGHRSSNPGSVAGLPANSAMWFRLSHSIRNSDLSALRCRCDGCLHTFGHLGPLRRAVPRSRSVFVSRFVIRPIQGSLPIHELRRPIQYRGIVILGLTSARRRVATRCDKLAANYLAFVKLACIRLWLRVYEFTALVATAYETPVKLTGRRRSRYPSGKMVTP
jgi:hypothetical protein